MAQYQLENGQTLNVPDDLDPTKRAQIAEDVKSVYGIDINEVSVLDRILDAPKSIARGALSLATDVPLGLAGLVDIGDDSKVVKGLQGFQDFLRTDSSLASDPALRDKYTTKLAEGIGSFGPFLGAGLAGRALAKRGIVSKTAGDYGIPAALAIPSGMAGQVDRLQMARDMGEEVGPISETFATLIGGAIGITEILPIINILKKVPKVRDKGESDYVVSKLKSAVQSGAFEGGQEVTASLLQDLTARGLYSDELPIGESMFDEFTIGAIIGGGADLLFSSLGNKRSIGNEYIKDRENKARDNINSLINDEKFLRASAQGNVPEITEETSEIKPNIPVPGITGEAPDLDIIQLSNGTFAVVDQLKTIDPVIAEAPNEIEAIKLKDNLLNQFERNKINSRLNNDLYSMGYNESSTAYEIGSIVTDPNSTEVDISSILNADSRLADPVTKKKITTKNIKLDSEDLKLWVEENYGVPYKKSYSMEEAKKLLKEKDFNSLTSAFAENIFSSNQKSKKIKSIKDGKEEIDVSFQALRDLFASKNIDTNRFSIYPYSKPLTQNNFSSFFKKVTGEGNFYLMNQGQLELLFARVDSLPSFNTLTPLPDFSKREYTAQDMADFVATVETAEFNFEDIVKYLESRIDFESGNINSDSTREALKFENDLLNSGRAEDLNKKVPLTDFDIYKIKENFEYDIARRAEGFNETPEEFEARLIAENKPKELIDQLVEKEREKQSRFTAPVKVEPPSINFPEAIEEGRTNKFATELKKTLNKVGLKETGVIVSNDILSSENLIAGKEKIFFDPVETRRNKTESSYDENTDTIFISLNAVNPDGTATDIEIQNKLNSIIDAQVIHAFRAKDLINEKEYNFLRKEIRRRKVPVGFDEKSKGKTFYERSKNINESKLTDLQKARGVDFIDEFYVESAIADLYKAKDIKPDIPPKATGIFNKFSNFFKKVGIAMRASGYKKSSEIFNDIEAGKIGSRVRGETRTLRELDKLSIRSETDSIFEVEDRPEIVPSEILEDDKKGTTFFPAIEDFPVTTNINVGDVKNKPIKGVILNIKDKGVLKPAVVQNPSKRYNVYERTVAEEQIEKEFILDGIEGKTSIGVMEWFVKNSPSTDYKYIAQSVLKQLKRQKALGFDTEIFITDPSFLAQKSNDDTIRYVITNMTGEYSGVAGYSHDPYVYDDKKVKKHVVINSNGGLNFNTILHEFVHAATTLSLKLSDPIRLSSAKRRRRADPLSKFNLGTDYSTQNYKNLEKIRKLLRSEVNRLKTIDPYMGTNSGESKIGNARYGTKNVFELLSVGLTDPKFQDFMESIEYKKTNVWDAFVNEIRKILGLEAKRGTVLSAFLKESSLALKPDSEANKAISEYKKQKAVREGFELDADFSSLTSPVIESSPPVETRDESSGMANDFVDMTRGPRASNLLENVDGDSFSPNDIYRNPRFYMESQRGEPIFKEIIAFMEKLKQIKDNPNATITMYRASPTDDLRAGDFITHSKTEAQNYVNNSQITRQEIRNAERDRRRQEQINKKGAISLEKEKLYNTMDSIFDLGEIAEPSVSKLYTYQLKAGDVRWDGNSLERWGYFPSNVVKLNVFEDSSRSPNPSPSLIDAVEKAEELVKKTPIGQIPPYNIKASDVALKAAQDYAVDPSPAIETSLPKNKNKQVPEEYKEQAKQEGYQPTAMTFGERIIKFTADPVTNIKSSFNRLRTEIIDKYDDIDKAITKGSETNEEVRLLNNAITTSSIAAIRLADKAKGVFAQMLTRGTPASQIEGQESSTFVKEFEFSAEHNKFIKNSDIGKGGLLQFTAPLYENPLVDLEYIFAKYAIVNRVSKLKNGVVIPISLRDAAKNAEEKANIKANYPQVVEVYENYQKWNNELVKFARNKGLLSEGQAEQWIDHSSYYPFYKEMIDDEGRSAPSIGGGMLPGNPLSIKMEGSEKIPNVPPLEAIARNSLSILTASMKNDGLSKLVRDMQLMDMARPKNPKTKPNAMTVFVFEDGEKKIYQIDDREIFEAVRSVGGVKVDALTKAFSMPAGFLRDMITRDPGFIVVNILRDTLSSAVTSGAKLGIGGDTFTPIVDSVANMFKDMTDLEKFGIVGGYDFANDEGDIVRYMSRARRQQGLTPGNGISLENAFFKLWDGLGGLTTKSDGATRLAVYNSVYSDLKKQGASEAEAQSAAAYQGLEIINFGRRGSSQFFGMITAAIPFLNARIQGLDILYRTSRGRYSATEKLQSGESAQDLKKRITRTALLRGLSLMGITLLYYLMVSDTEDYKGAPREVRDDNWLIPTPFDYTLKIPIPFEIGAVFKAIPERMFDLAAGQIKEDGSVEKDTTASIARQIQTATNIPFLMGDISIQAIKPFFEAVTNRNSFTGTEIVPYYKQKGQAGLQSNPQTNEVARLIGELFNISPMKIEYVMKGYTGTLGGYALAVADSIARTATGSPYIPNNIVSNPTNFTRLPFVNRLIMDTKKMKGLQQGFYELRQEVDKVTQTLNSLRKQGRFDELAAYRENYQGVSNVKSQVRALEKYMANFRKRRDAIMKRQDISIIVKSDLIRDLEINRNKRLSIVPALRAKANVPILQGGL